MARPQAIFTIRHPSYPSIWAYVTHVILDTRFPFFRACSWNEGGARGRGYHKGTIIQERLAHRDLAMTIPLWPAAKYMYVAKVILIVPIDGQTSRREIYGAVFVR